MIMRVLEVQNEKDPRPKRLGCDNAQSIIKASTLVIQCST